MKTDVIIDNVRLERGYEISTINDFRPMLLYTVTIPNEDKDRESKYDSPISITDDEYRSLKMKIKDRIPATISLLWYKFMNEIIDYHAGYFVLGKGISEMSLFKQFNEKFLITKEEK